MTDETSARSRGAEDGGTNARADVAIPRASVSVQVPGVPASDAASERPARRSIEHTVLFIGSNLALGVLGVFALWVDADPRGFGTHEKLGLPPCAPMELWNIPCPGCGVTTSFALAAHGHVLDSFVNQPFGCALAVSVPLFATWAWLVHLRNGDLRDELSRRATWPWAAGVTVFAACSWVYKLARVRGWIG